MGDIIIVILLLLYLLLFIFNWLLFSNIVFEHEPFNCFVSLVKCLLLFWIQLAQLNHWRQTAQREEEIGKPPKKHYFFYRFLCPSKLKIGGWRKRPRWKYFDTWPLWSSVASYDELCLQISHILMVSYSEPAAGATKSYRMRSSLSPPLSVCITLSV